MEGLGTASHLKARGAPRLATMALLFCPLLGVTSPKPWHRLCRRAAPVRAHPGQGGLLLRRWAGAPCADCQASAEAEGSTRLSMKSPAQEQAGMVRQVDERAGLLGCGAYW